MKNTDTASAARTHFAVLCNDTVEATVSSEQARRNRIAKGEECPNCDDTTSIEDNGCTGDELTYLCTACAHQWDAVNYLGDFKSWRR